MQTIAYCPRYYSGNTNNTFQFTKNSQVSQDQFLAAIGLSIGTMESLNCIVDATYERLGNGQLDVSPLTKEQETMFFGGSGNV